MDHVILSQLRAAELGAVLLGQLVEGLDQTQPENRLAPHVAASTAAAINAAIALIEAWANGPAAEAEAEGEGADEQQPDDGICRHPAEQRNTKVATHGKPNAWLCRACGFYHEGEPTHG